MMSNSYNLTLTKIDNTNSLKLKKIQWASALNALMIHSGKSRSEMAQLCGISKGRITRILSGEANLTIETICLFANVLKFDVDIAFFNSPTTKPFQPWNKGQKEFSIFREYKKIISEHASIPPIYSECISNSKEISFFAPLLSDHTANHGPNIGLTSVTVYENRPLKEFVF